MLSPRQPVDVVSQSCVKVYDGVAGITMGDVFLALWQSPARRERIRTVTGWTRSLMEETDGLIIACQFLLPCASPPDRAGRAEVRRGFRIVETRARRLITVPIGNAMWQGVVRSIIRAAIAVWGRSKLIKIAGSEDEAYGMIEQVGSDKTPNRQRLKAGLAALFQALGVEKE